MKSVDFQSLRYHGNICISGLTASGKTTHSHLLAGNLGLTYVSGSQIQLNFRGLSPIQTKDFWITDEAKSLWNEHDFRRIDSELLRIEGRTDGAVFDTSTMPWRHRREALCIWLGSDLSSRVNKSIVSHRGRGEYDPEAYDSRIQEKDAATQSLYRTLYGIGIGEDLTPFDLVLDLSHLISGPTFDAAMSSIASAHSIIEAAVSWYLTGRPDFGERYERELQTNSDIVVREGVEARVEANLRRVVASGV